MLSNRFYLGEVRHATAGRNLNAHEPMTDLGTWTAAQIKPRRRAHSVAYPLSGIARCAGCGGPLTGQLSKDRQGSRGRRYRCSRRRSDSCVSIGADVLEAHTRAVITDAIGTARPIVSPGARGLAQAEEALRVAEAILNAYAADTELQADLGMDAYRAGARQRREALQAAQRALSRGGGAGQRGRDTTGRRPARRRSDSLGDGRGDRGQWRAQGRRGPR